MVLDIRNKFKLCQGVEQLQESISHTYILAILKMELPSVKIGFYVYKITFKMFAVASVVVIKKQKHALYFEIFFSFSDFLRP